MLSYRDGWLSQLSKVIGGALCFNEQGMCQLIFGREFVVTFYKPEVSDDLIIFGQLPVVLLSEEILKNMLMENRSSAKQCVPVISLSDNAEAIEVHVKLDERELMACDLSALESVVQSLAYWKAELETIVQSNTPRVRSDLYVLSGKG